LAVANHAMPSRSHVSCRVCPLRTREHIGHSSLPSRTYQRDRTGVPVGAASTGIEAGECDTNRNASLAADRPQRLNSCRPPAIWR
jgi:hypothetical protein